MACIFMESFDLVTSVSLLNRKWTSMTNSSMSLVAGRFDGQALKQDSNTDSLNYTFPSNVTTIVFGFGFKMDAPPVSTRSILEMRDGGTIQCGWAMTSTGQFIVYTQNTSHVLATSGSALGSGTWYHIEMKWIIDNSDSGSVEVRVNNSSVGWIPQTFAANSFTGNNYINEFRLTGCLGVMDCYWDDFYVLDSSGSYNTTFKGDSRVVAVFPTGNGATNNFTPSAGSNYQNVDDASPDDDSTYNSSSTVGHRDLYTYTAITGTPAIYAAQSTVCVEKTDAGARSIARTCKSGATTDVGTSVNPTTQYTYFNSILETDPHTSAPWTVTNLNNAQFGLDITA